MASRLEAIASLTDDGARAASTVANHKRGHKKWIQFAVSEGFDPEITAQDATPTGQYAWRFRTLTERLCAFVLWLWISPKDRGAGFRTSESVTHLATGLAMTVKRLTGFPVLHLHGLYKLRLEGMARLEAKWGKTICRARPLRMKELVTGLLTFRHVNATHQRQLPLALRTGIAFCLRVGELTKQRNQRHFLLKQGVTPVHNDHGALIGVSLDVVTSKGIWRKSGQRTRAIQLDPDRLGHCGMCARVILQPRVPLPRVTVCADCGGPKLEWSGLDGHASAALDLLQYVTDNPPSHPKEPLFPALGYDSVSAGLAVIAACLGLERKALTTHCLRRGGTCDKTSAVREDGTRAFTSANIRVFGRWASKIWEIIYAESRHSVLELP